MAMAIFSYIMGEQLDMANIHRCFFLLEDTNISQKKQVQAIG